MCIINTMPSSISIAETKAIIDDYLTNLLYIRKQEAGQINATYQALWSRIEHIVLVGGKRIRPYLTIVGNDGFDDKILPVAVAQELVHVAMLIHDDVIDQDDVRHGEKNISGIYRDVYSNYVNTDRAAHYANSTGILAGDVLLSEAYRLLYKVDYSENTKRLIAEQLASSVFEVIGGELMDVEATFVDDIGFDPNDIYRYKTAGYSFIGPLLVGAYCQDTDSQICEILEKYAASIGIAFQMQDDLLDLYGDIVDTGKLSNIADLREGKRTALVAFHEQLMNESHAKNFKYFGKSIATNGLLQKIKLDMVESGAKQKTENLILEYLQQARIQLDKIPDSFRKTALVELTSRIEARKK
ncbi:polyprenyl synthetase family protein [Candidatus Saccharibacteria bacterium]|nr:polyprenyl synthetase family protein [Candidatus Saccharibacteria bacterium]